MVATLGIGSVWQCEYWSRQQVWPDHVGMTNTAISPSHSTNQRYTLGAPVGADLAFWTAAGAVVAALSGPLGECGGVPAGHLVPVGLALP